MSDAKCICSPPTKQCPAHSWLAFWEERKSQNYNPRRERASLPASRHLYTEHDTVLYGIFHWHFGLSIWLWALPVSCSPAH